MLSSSSDFRHFIPHTPQVFETLGATIGTPVLAQFSVNVKKKNSSAVHFIGNSRAKRRRKWQKDTGEWVLG